MPRFSAKIWFFYGLVIVAVVIFVHLGCWQLNRADEKKGMLQRQQQLAQQKAKPLFKFSEPMQYQKVLLTGRFLAPLFYLDNQHYQHQFGYDIISPFRTDDGLIVLINRGWLAGDITRQSLPRVDTDKKSTKVKGYVYYPSMIKWQLGPQIEKKIDGTYLLEQIDIEAVRSLLSQPLADYTVRMQSDDGDGFIQAWPIVAMSPNRHIGYAIQWFALALGLVLMMGFFLKNQYEPKSKKS